MFAGRNGHENGSGVVVLAAGEQRQVQGTPGADEGGDGPAALALGHEVSGEFVHLVAYAMAQPDRLLLGHVGVGPLQDQAGVRHDRRREDVDAQRDGREKLLGEVRDEAVEHPVGMFGLGRDGHPAMSVLAGDFDADRNTVGVRNRAEDGGGAVGRNGGIRQGGTSEDGGRAPQGRL